MFLQKLKDDSKMHIEIQKTYHNQNDFKKKQKWQSPITWSQDSL